MIPIPSLRETLIGIYGAWRLARLERGAMSYFDASAEGFWKSFSAAALLLPGYITAPLARWWAELDTSHTLAVVLLSLLVLDAVMMAINLMSFQRRRLNFSG